MNIEHRSPFPQQGSVLILALWVLFFLAALALAVGAHVSAGLRLAGSMQQDARAYHVARAGVAYAAMQVACHTNQWDAWTGDAWNSDPATFTDQAVGDGGFFSIINVAHRADGVVTNAGIVGVESRLNLNGAYRKVLAPLLVETGAANGGEAADIYKSFETYRGERALTNAVQSDYSLSSVHELLLIKGMDADVFARVEPYVTVLGRDKRGRINANTASFELLRSYAEVYGAASDGIEKIMAARGRGESFEPFRSDDDLKKAAAGTIVFLTVSSTAFRGIAVGRTSAGSEAAWIEFVVDGDGNRLYWHEF